MRRPRIRVAWLLGALALPFTFASGCSTPAPDSAVTPLQRIENKDDGPPQPVEDDHPYQVTISDLQFDQVTYGDPQTAPTQPRLILNLKGNRFGPCDDLTGCESSWGSMSGDDLRHPFPVTVEPPPSDDGNSLGDRLGGLTTIVTDTGTYRIHIDADFDWHPLSVKITGVTVTATFRW